MTQANEWQNRRSTTDSQVNPEVTEPVPDLAHLIGESHRVPTDRPMDGIDMSSFMVGLSDTSGRDHYLYMGVDAEIISAKWKTFEVYFATPTSTRGRRRTSSGRCLVMNLINDPHEEIDLMDSELTYAWVIGLASAPLLELAQSAAQYPHIAPGADFQGDD